MLRGYNNGYRLVWGCVRGNGRKVALRLVTYVSVGIYHHMSTNTSHYSATHAIVNNREDNAYSNTVIFESPLHHRTQQSRGSSKNPEGAVLVRWASVVPCMKNVLRTTQNADIKKRWWCLVYTYFWRPLQTHSATMCCCRTSPNIALSTTGAEYRFHDKRRNNGTTTVPVTDVT